MRELLLKLEDEFPAKGLSDDPKERSTQLACLNEKGHHALEACRDALLELAPTIRAW